MILAPQALPDQLAHVLDTALTALLAASEFGSDVAEWGAKDVLKQLTALGGVYVLPSYDHEPDPSPTAPALPPLAIIDCPMCQGLGGFEFADPGASTSCMACGGCGETEVCSGCGATPKIQNGLEYCHCSKIDCFEYEVAA